MDKLSGMCKTEKESYEKYWDSISPFIKFGCLKDTKFCDKMSDYILFKNIEDKYLTLKECIEKNGGTVVTPKEEDAKDKEDGNDVEEIKTTIYYVTNEQQQSQYIKMFKEEGLDAVWLTHNIDSAFITQLEQRNPTVRFQRIDAEVTEHFKEEVAEEEKEEAKKLADDVTEVFRKALNNEQLDVKVEKLKNDNVASVITLSEQTRRMQEMMKMYGMDSGMYGAGNDATLTLNANHPLVKYVVENKDGENVTMICEQLYDLAMLANQPLSPEQMTKFVERSNQILLMLAK